MNAKIILQLSVLLIAGCATTSGIVPLGPDRYLVTRRAAAGSSGSEDLKADALREANQYCRSQHRKMQVLSTAEVQPPFIMGNFPKAEVQFECK